MGLVLPLIPVPLRIDYTRAMSAVRDQGDEGTCVAFASVVGVKEYFDKKEYRKTIRLSPRYVYDWCKKSDGAPEEEGTYPRVAMKVLFKYGACFESCWPYQAHQKNFPCAEAASQARTYRIKAYARINGLAQMKRSLVINGPFLAGVKVFDSWFTKKALKTGVIAFPGPSDEVRGGHAICIIGYDDSQKIFKFKNSWSSKWGDAGYGYLDYKYIQRYCLDAWSATDLIENPKALVRKIEEIIGRYA